MKHMFYILVPPRIPFPLENTQGLATFSNFFLFIFKFKHGFAIFLRSLAGFHSNLISKIPCSKRPNLPLFSSILLEKCKYSCGSFQKDRAQFHLFLWIHSMVLSTKTQKKLHKFHFISKIPGLPAPPVFGGRGQKSPFHRLTVSPHYRILFSSNPAAAFYQLNGKDSPKKPETGCFPGLRFLITNYCSSCPRLLALDFLALDFLALDF
jgi:hypothetical protein